MVYKSFLLLISLFLGILSAHAQSKMFADHGYRLVKIIYKGDTVSILIKAKKGEEQKPKPIFLFCQGSLPKPLLLHSKDTPYGAVPFATKELLEDYHLVMIGKPYIPLEADIASLGEEYTYHDSTGAFPKNYSLRNHLDYYVERNIHVLQYLQKQSWVTSQRLVIAGHSEGSTVVAKLASVFPKVTHVIYASGSPLGRITGIIANDRQQETDSTQMAERDLQRWQEIVNNPSPTYPAKGDSYKTTYSFSLPPIQYLQQVKIPVFVTYGTKDAGAAPFNDYLRIEMTRQHKTNFTWKAYIGREHNFFKVKPDGKTDYDDFGWDIVMADWLQWLRQH